MKLAVVGKGGVGKTIVAGTLARILASEGYNVIAVDADPNLNLGMTLGLSREELKEVIPISQNQDLIRSRVESSFKGVISFTPKVEDIVERYGIENREGLKLLVMGTVRSGDSGCMCQENAFLRALLSHLILGRRDVVILDMVAGLEHMGRGTARGVDAMLCVVEPSAKSIETAGRILELAKDIEVREVLGIGNKISTSEQAEFIQKMMQEIGIPIIESIPFDGLVLEAEMRGISPYEHSSDGEAIEAIKRLASKLKRKYLAS